MGNDTYAGRRFIADRHFFLDLMKKKKEDAVAIFDKLNKIHFCQKFCGGRLFNNLMLDDCLAEVTKKKPDWMFPILGAFHPDGNAKKDLHSAIIKNAVAAAGDVPFTVAILTSEEEAKKYSTNQHYHQYPEIREAITIHHTDDAIAEIEKAYEYCMK